MVVTNPVIDIGLAFYCNVLALFLVFAFNVLGDASLNLLVIACIFYSRSNRSDVLDQRHV